MCKVTIKCPVDLGRKLALAHGRWWGLTQQTCTGQAPGATSASARGPRGYRRCSGLGCTGGQRRPGLRGAASVLLWVQAPDGVGSSRPGRGKATLSLGHTGAAAGHSPACTRSRQNTRLLRARQPGLTFVNLLHTLPLSGVFGSFSMRLQGRLLRDLGVDSHSSALVLNPFGHFLSLSNTK